MLLGDGHAGSWYSQQHLLPKLAHHLGDLIAHGWVVMWFTGIFLWQIHDSHLGVDSQLSGWAPFFSFRELGMLDPPVILGDIGSGTEV